MNCKYCNAELVDGKPFCPSCGKSQVEIEEVAAEVTEETVAAEETVIAEETVETAAEEQLPFETAYEQPDETPIKEGVKATPGKIAVAVVAGILVLAILIGLIVGSLGGAIGGDTPTIAPTSGTVAATEPVEIPSDGDPASPLCKESYTVTDEESVKLRDAVVATMGDKQLTNGELQAYYWMEVSLFLNECSGYAEYIGLDLYSYLGFVGLDLYSPLDTQLTDSGEVPMSWQQYFLSNAINNWKTYQSMALEAEAAGYVLPAERQEELDNLPAELEENAKNAGLASVDELVKLNVGPGAKLEDYVKYVETYYKGMSYYTDYCNALDPTDDEIEAYFTENEAYYADNNITKDTKYVDVRHVLLQPEGGETGEDGYPVYTDEAWETCRLKAEEIYNQWQQGDKSEDSFAQLAMENSMDGNASTGGLYEDVYEGQMVEAFENWCFDGSRQVGDHGLVKTPFGYHIMFFCGSRDAWISQAKTDLLDEMAYELVTSVTEKHPATVDYSLVALGEVDIA